MEELPAEECLEQMLKNIEKLDVRIVCERRGQEWHIKTLRIKRMVQESQLPELIQYPSILFLRETVMPERLITLIGQLKEDNSVVVFGGMALTHLRLSFYSRVNHLQGRARYGLEQFLLPTWRFGASWSSSLDDIHKNTSILVGIDPAPYFPRLVDGEAWFLYETSIPSQTTSVGDIDIVLEDDRAYFTGIRVDPDAYVVSLAGSQLGECFVHLYTSGLQLESRKAEAEVAFSIVGNPDRFSLIVVDSQGEWLDRRDVDKEYFGRQIPEDVTIINQDLNEDVIIRNLIMRQGESLRLEYKSKLEFRPRPEKDRFLQSIVAFANTEGGTILLGVEDDGTVVGVDPHGIREMVLNKIEDCLDGAPKVRIGQHNIDEKIVVAVDISECDEKPCAIRADSNRSVIYVRRDGSNKLAKPEDYRQMFVRNDDKTVPGMPWLPR